MASQGTSSENLSIWTLTLPLAVTRQKMDSNEQQLEANSKEKGMGNGYGFLPNIHTLSVFFEGTLLSTASSLSAYYSSIHRLHSVFLKKARE